MANTTARLATTACATLFAALLSGMPAEAASSSGPRVEFTEFGIFQTTRVKDVPQPVSVSGRMSLVTNIRMLKRTRLIVGQQVLLPHFARIARSLPPGKPVTFT